MKILINSEAEMTNLAYLLSSHLSDNIIILLNGPLGAGKTTFTKGIAKGLLIDDIIVSPTFNILKKYQGRMLLKHFDMYRLEGSNDDLGFDDELVEPNTVSVIEWPNYYANFDETHPFINISIEIIDENSRLMTIDFNNLDDLVIKELKKCINL